MTPSTLPSSEYGSTLSAWCRKDRVVIPDLVPKEAKKDTGAFRLFTIATGEAVLRLKLLDANGKPIAGKTCQVLSGRFGPPTDLGSLRQVNPPPVTDATGLITPGA